MEACFPQKGDHRLCAGRYVQTSKGGPNDRAIASVAKQATVKMAEFVAHHSHDRCWRVLRRRRLTCRLLLLLYDPIACVGVDHIAGRRMSQH